MQNSAAPPLWRILSEVGYFIGLACAIGFAVTYLIAVHPALADAEPADRAVLRRRAGALLGLAGPVLLVTAYFQLAGRVARASTATGFGAALAPARMWEFLTTPAKSGAWISTGTEFLVQKALVVLTAALFVSALYPGIRLDRVAGYAAPAAILSTLVGAVPVNFAKETADDLANSAFVQLHIIGAMVWIGGLALLLGLAGARRGLGMRAGDTWSAIWRRFSGLALVAVGCVLIAGLWLAWKHVGSVSQLWTTTYGRFLLVKLLLVLGMLGSGAVNQLWLIPRVMRARSAGQQGSLFALTLRGFPKVITVEVLLALGVLVIVPFLSGSARKQAGDAAAAPVTSGSILLVGLILVAMVIASFIATAKTSSALGNRVASTR